MRYLVISDIHGGARELEKTLCYFEKFECDYIVLLGDLLNHGPRNTVPKGGTKAGFAVIEEEKIDLYDLEGEVISTYKF